MEITEEQRQQAINDIELMIEALAHPGWTLIHKNFQEAFDDQNHVMRVSSERELYQAQGRLMTLAQILTIRDTLVGELEKLENPQTEVSLEEDTFSEEFYRQMEP